MSALNHPKRSKRREATAKRAVVSAKRNINTSFDFLNDIGHTAPKLETRVGP